MEAEEDIIWMKHVEGRRRGDITECERCTLPVFKAH